MLCISNEVWFDFTFLILNLQEAIRFRAVADYTALEETELSLIQNELLTLVKEGDDGWWYCRNLENNLEGWAPSGYLEINAIDVTDGKFGPFSQVR